MHGHEYRYEIEAHADALDVVGRIATRMFD
jgi:hypothetical protein